MCRAKGELEVPVKTTSSLARQGPVSKQGAASKQGALPVVQLLLLGKASTVLGAREVSVPWAPAFGTIGGILRAVSLQHEVPLTLLTQPDFRVARNGVLLAGDLPTVLAAPLMPGDELALLPPVTGG